MRALFLVPLLVLAGCNSITRQNGDYFQTAGVDPARFSADDQACGQLSAEYVAYDVRGMDGSSYQRTRNYNALYVRCMRGLGYVPQAYATNWLPG